MAQTFSPPKQVIDEIPLFNSYSALLLYTNTGGDILKKEKREKRFFNTNHGLINDHRLHGLIGLPFQQRIKMQIIRITTTTTDYAD